VQGASAEKLFTVLPGGDADAIRLTFDGAHALRVARAGTLEVETGNGTVHFSRPVAYQEFDGGRRYVEVAYRVNGADYGFALGNYDRTQPLVIDPLLASTYLGGNGSEPAGFPWTPMARDAASGDIFVAGSTTSSDFPTTAGAHDTTFGSSTCRLFIARLSFDLATLNAATYLGGSACDEVATIKLDAGGNIYVAGTAVSQDFPTTAGAYKTTHGEYSDAFVARFDAGLTTLVASTLIGDTGTECASSGTEGVSAMTLDGAGNVLIAGGTSSRTFPVTAGAYQTTISTGWNNWPCGQDAFVARLAPNLGSLLAATYYGTGGQDNWSEQVYGISVDASDNVYIYGWAPHDTLPVTVNGGLFGGGNSDAFVAKFDSALATLSAARYVGGAASDVARAGAFDAAGYLYLTGYTTSADFPTTAGAYAASKTNLQDAFVVKLDTNLGVVASTYVGGSGNDSGLALTLDGSAPVVAGYTTSSNFPVSSSAYNSKPNSFGDIFVTKFDAALAAISASTAFGGTYGGESVGAVIADGGGNLFIAGSVSNSSGVPDIDVTSGAYRTSYNGGPSDMYVAKFSNDLSGTPDIAAAPAAHDFGAVVIPASAYPSHTFTVSNLGTGYLNISSVSKSGNDGGHFQIDANGCSSKRLRPANVEPAAGRSCTIQVSFQPYSSGAKSAQLTVSSNDPDTPVAVVNLSGTASYSGGDGGGGGGTVPPESGGGGGGGCALAVDRSGFDPLLILLLVGAAGALRWRHRKHGDK
jgi:hypothetical protein